GYPRPARGGSRAADTASGQGRTGYRSLTMKYFYFVWKNLGRKKVRTTLTILSIAVAFLLFGLLRTLGTAFDQGAELVGEDRLATIHRVSIIQPLPVSYVSRVQALEGVELATHASWFGGYYQDPKNQFA